MDTLSLFKYAYGCDPDLLPKNVIIGPFISTERTGEIYENVRKFRGRMYSVSLVSGRGREAAIIRCGMGDRLSGDAVMLLAGTKARNLIFAGSCASLSGADIGDLVVAESAVNGEGFSRYFTEGFTIENILDTGGKVNADRELTLALEEFLKAEKGEGSFHLKDVFTIGSICAEKTDVLTALNEKGITAVEMELSGVFTASRAVGIKAAALLWVSDLPFEKPLWQESGKNDAGAYKKGMDEAFRLSARFALSL